MLFEIVLLIKKMSLSRDRLVSQSRNYTVRTKGGWKAPGTQALARPRVPAGFQPGGGLFPERDSNRFGLFPGQVWDQLEEPPGFQLIAKS